MALKFTTTSEGGHFASVLVYGPSGVGKTRMAATAPKPIIISSEKKLISLKDYKIPVILIENYLDLEEAYTFVTTNKKAEQFQTIVVDSISDIAETILTDFKNDPRTNDHGQAAYGHLADKLGPMIKKFRDIRNKHKYFIAKSRMVEDVYTKVNMFVPSLPGRVLPDNISYEFDYVFALRIGETETFKKYRYLQTQPCMQWAAKGNDSLAAMEKPDLTSIFKKLTAGPVKKNAARKPLGDESAVKNAGTNTQTEVKDGDKNGQDAGEKTKIPEEKVEDKEEKTEAAAENPETGSGADDCKHEEIQDTSSFDIAD